MQGFRIECFGQEYARCEDSYHTLLIWRFSYLKDLEKGSKVQPLEIQLWRSMWLLIHPASLGGPPPVCSSRFVLDEQLGLGFRV